MKPAFNVEAGVSLQAPSHDVGYEYRQVFPLYVSVAVAAYFL